MLQDYGVWGVLFIYFGAFAPFFTHVRLFSYNYSIHLKWHFQYYWKLKLARANIVGRMIKFLEFKHIFSALKIRCVQKVTNPLKWEDSNIKPFSGFCGQNDCDSNPTFRHGDTCSKPDRNIIPSSHTLRAQRSLFACWVRARVGAKRISGARPLLFMQIDAVKV